MHPNDGAQLVVRVWDSLRKGPGPKIHLDALRTLEDFMGRLFERRLFDQLRNCYGEVDGVDILSFQERDVIRQLRRERPGLRAWVAGIVFQSCAGRVDGRNDFDDSLGGVLWLPSGCATIAGIDDEKNVQRIVVLYGFPACGVPNKFRP